MTSSEHVQELYDFVMTARMENGGKLNAGQTDAILDQLFVIHKQLIISEFRPVPPIDLTNVVPLDAKRLAQGGAIKSYARKSIFPKWGNYRPSGYLSSPARTARSPFLTPIINLFKRRLK